MMVKLKEIEFCEHKSYMRHHKIKMIFAEKEDSEELYTFYSTIEVSYCFPLGFNLGRQDVIYNCVSLTRSLRNRKVTCS